MSRAILTSPFEAHRREAPPAAASSATALAAGASSIELRQSRFAAAVSAVVQSQRAIAALQGQHVELVERARAAGAAVHSRDSFTGGPRWSVEMVAERQIATELAAALNQTEGDARRLLATSTALVTQFTATHAALSSGDISYRHAEKIVQHSALLPDDALPDYESTLLRHAHQVSPQRLGRVAHAAAEIAQPTDAIQRHLDAAVHRRLYLDPAADGMAYLTQYLPALEAVAIHNRATELARSAKNTGDPRTLTQLKVDALTDLMLNAETQIPTVTRGIRARVNVTVPAFTLLGSQPSDESNGNGEGSAAGEGASAQLEGYGPIDRLTALQLTRTTPGFQRVLTDPMTGAVLTYERTRYRAPADLDDLIRLTHAECTFPTDCASSATADLDHTIVWNEGGHTGYGNLGPLCSSHHKVKHHTEWSIEQDPGGTITWTSPAGFAYIVPPSTPSTAKVAFAETRADVDLPPPF